MYKKRYKKKYKKKFNFYKLKPYEVGFVSPITYPEPHQKDTENVISVLHRKFAPVLVKPIDITPTNMPADLATEISHTSSDDAILDTYIGNVAHSTSNTTWHQCAENVYSWSRYDPLWRLPCIYSNFHSTISTKGHHIIKNTVDSKWNLDNLGHLGEHFFLMFFFTNMEADTSGDTTKYRFPYDLLSQDWACYIYKTYQFELNRVLGLGEALDKVDASLIHIVNGADLYYSATNHNRHIQISQMDYNPYARTKINEYADDDLQITHTDGNYENNKGMPHYDNFLDIGNPTNFWSWWYELKRNITMIPRIDTNYFSQQRLLDTSYKIHDLINTNYHNTHFVPDEITALFLMGRTNDSNYQLTDTGYHIDLPLIMPSPYINNLQTNLNSHYAKTNIIHGLMLPPVVIGISRAFCSDNIIDPAKGGHYHVMAECYIRQDADATHLNPYYNDAHDYLLVLKSMDSSVEEPNYKAHL